MLDTTLIRVSIGYAFIGIVTEFETCHIYKAVLQTIKVATRNSFGVTNFFHNII
jgi:hypothetical protein